MLGELLVAHQKQPNGPQKHSADDCNHQDNLVSNPCDPSVVRLLNLLTHVKIPALKAVPNKQRFVWHPMKGPVASIRAHLVIMQKMQIKEGCPLLGLFCEHPLSTINQWLAIFSRQVFCALDQRKALQALACLGIVSHYYIIFIIEVL